MAEGNSFLSFVFNKHTIIHGALMLGMVFTPVAAFAAAAGSSATFGDIAVGAADMAWSMVSGWGDGGVIFDAFSNAASGDLAPASYEFGMMDHGDMTSHTAQAPQLSPQLEGDADFFGKDPDDYIEGWGVDGHVP